ncbi:hypothetical protein [Gracilimonas sp.]|uniref:hypothetical protein n=1 Tax=Gracilimonas sp. TaxID=1974203 RepID=UPI00287142F9|nr:hypothetical protein [Gracilimonas sp.]
MRPLQGLFNYETVNELSNIYSNDGFYGLGEDGLHNTKLRLSNAYQDAQLPVL